MATAVMSREEEIAHRPVMVTEVLAYLRPRPGGRYVDATVGAGGHAWAILDASAPDGRLLGLDRDPDALALAAERLRGAGDRVVLVRGSFEEVDRHLSDVGWREVDGIVADLGLSTMQLGHPDRGFSFAAEGPLDMRFDPDAEVTAADLVNRLRERDLADLIHRYGEERRARAIARRLVRRRPLRTTAELRAAVVSVLGPGRRGGIDPATRTFQALRIAVNRELEALEELLARSVFLLAPEGRLVVLSYHSLEDRIVKHGFRALAGREEAPRFRVLTRKPVGPDGREVESNPRARSAKLRALERIE